MRFKEYITEKIGSVRELDRVLDAIMKGGDVQLSRHFVH